MRHQYNSVELFLAKSDKYTANSGGFINPAWAKANIQPRKGKSPMTKAKN
jgi:hypothetical protein